MMITATGQDVYVNMDKFEIGRNFGTKMWNAARFMKMHMEKTPLDWQALANEGDPVLDAAQLTDDDRHLLTVCDNTSTALTDHLESFRLQDGARLIYDFLWTDLCDWYLEAVKNDLYEAAPQRRETVLRVMTHVFSKGLRMLHPYMPFITEELWHQMGYGAAEESIMRATFPTPMTAAVAKDYGMTTTVERPLRPSRTYHRRTGSPCRLRHRCSQQVRFIIHVNEVANAARLEAST